MHRIESADVIQGATVQVTGKPPIIFQTGTTLINLRDVRHAGFTVTGETS